MGKIEEIAGEPSSWPASPKELRNYFEQTRGISRAGERTVGRKGLQALLDEGKAVLVFKDDRNGDVAGMVFGEADPPPNGRFRGKRGEMGPGEFLALLDGGKAFVIFKDRGCGLCIAHEVAGVVDGGVELAEPIDAWDVILLQGKETKK